MAMATYIAGKMSAMTVANQRMTDRALFIRKCCESSCGTRRNSAKVTGSRKPMGSPSTISPTLPFKSWRENLSGRSVCRSCGKGERGRSTIYSSMLSVARAPSMSIRESLRSSSATTAGSAMPSTYMTATLVRLFLPTTLLLSFSAGLQMRFRTSAVLVRSVSTKESLPPLSDFSIVGSPMLRCAVGERISKVTAHACSSNTTAQQPCVMSVTRESVSSRRWAVPL